MTLDWSSDMSDSQQYHLKPCLIKYELDIQVLFLKTVFFSVVVSMKKQWRNHQDFKNFEVRLRFQGYHWESDMLLDQGSLEIMHAVPLSYNFGGFIGPED